MATYTREQILQLYGEERSRAIVILKDIMARGNLVERAIAKRLRAQIPYKTVKRCPLGDDIIADPKTFVIEAERQFLQKHHPEEIKRYQLRRIDTTRRYSYDNFKFVSIKVNSSRNLAFTSLSGERDTMDD